MMIRQITSSSRFSPAGLSCCHLTHDLLLFMPGVFVDTVVWLDCTVLGITLHIATSEIIGADAS